MSASGTPATQGVKEEEVEGSGFVRIKVRDNARFRVTYRMRKTARLQALMDFYYNRVPAVDRCTGRFFFCGTRMQGWQTPADFSMEDGDEVDVIADTMSAAGTPATQRITEADDGFVTIKVQDLDRFRVTYTMRKNGKLQALFDFYYDRVLAVDRSTGRFLVEDKRLQGWQTPADFNMEDGDVVDVYAELLGGGGRLPV